MSRIRFHASCECATGKTESFEPKALVASTIHEWGACAHQSATSNMKPGACTELLHTRVVKRRNSPAQERSGSVHIAASHENCEAKERTGSRTFREHAQSCFTPEL